MGDNNSKDPGRGLNRTLWIVQALLALTFLFAGGVKLVMPVEELAKQAKPLSGQLLRVIGVLEVLGGIGVILPALLRIQVFLAPLAATGLVGIMIGAVIVTPLSNPPAMALLPLAVGMLAAFVAYGRWRLAPLAGRAPSTGS